MRMCDAANIACFRKVLKTRGRVGAVCRVIRKLVAGGAAVEKTSITGGRLSSESAAAGIVIVAIGI
jgi:hypothetical protein